MENTQGNFANLRAKLERGGFMTKWKGHAASVAPSASGIVLSIALGISPAAAQDISVDGTELIIGSGPVGSGNDVGSDGVLTLGAPNGVSVDGSLDVSDGSNLQGGTNGNIINGGANGNLINGGPGGGGNTLNGGPGGICNSCIAI